MIEIDIDRVSDILNGRHNSRGCGKTFAMLVGILSSLELPDMPNRIFIYCGNKENSGRLKNMTEMIANAMGFTFLSRRFNQVVLCKDGGGIVSLEFESCKDESKTIGWPRNSYAEFSDNIFEYQEPRPRHYNYRCALPHPSEEEYRNRVLCDWSLE